MKLPAFFGGIRGKLITIFVLIKVLPLVLLAWFAWHATQQLGEEVSVKAGGMADSMLSSIKTVGKTVTDDSIRALDLRSREAIEALTTDAAKEIANFLYDRDRDIRMAATLDPSEGSFQRFLAGRNQALYQHGAWKLAEDGKSWVPEKPIIRDAKVTRPVLPDNAKDFHARPPEYQGEEEQRPLFVEMTYVDLNGQEKIKVTTGNVTEKSLKNVVDRSNTFVKAETYFAELKKLKAGEIYVSDVIGAYVPTEAIGPYLPATLEKAGKPFKPENSAYAGTENPLGKRFSGIVSWAMPRSVTRRSRMPSRAITPSCGITRAAPFRIHAITSLWVTTLKPACRPPPGWMRRFITNGRRAASHHTNSWPKRPPSETKA